MASAVDEPSREQQYQRENRQGSSADMDILPDGPFSGDTAYQRTRENRLTDGDGGWQMLRGELGSEPVFRDADGPARDGDSGHFDEAKPLRGPSQFLDPNGGRTLQQDTSPLASANRHPPRRRPPCQDSDEMLRFGSLHDGAYHGCIDAREMCEKSPHVAAACPETCGRCPKNNKLDRTLHAHEGGDQSNDPVVAPEQQRDKVASGEAPGENGEYKLYVQTGGSIGRSDQPQVHAAWRSTFKCNESATREVAVPMRSEEGATKSKLYEDQSADLTLFRRNLGACRRRTPGVRANLKVRKG